MREIEFANPWMFLLLLLLIPLVVYYIVKRNSISSMKVSTVNSVKGLGRPIAQWLAHILFGVRLIAIILIIIALARPQKIIDMGLIKDDIDIKGIDIMLAIDVSGSMLAQDLKPDRLSAAKNAAVRFISNRPNDRIGLVIFSGESFTQCPLTTDHATLINSFNDVKSGLIEDGTAIGVGLANALNRLKKESKAESKVIVLLTDGKNNMGAINPIDAGNYAKDYNVRVYTIGVGTEGFAPYPATDRFGRTYMQEIKVEIDEEMLKSIAELTDGKYFRADNSKTLSDIYDEVDQLETTKLETKKLSRHRKEKEEKFLLFAELAFFLLIGEFLVRKTLLRSIP